MQNYLHAKSAHLFTLKKSIPYSQAFRIKLVGSTFDEYKKNSNCLVKYFVQKEYKKNIIPKKLNKTNAASSVTYSPTLLNITETINMHWHILNINNTFGNVFKTTPVIVFRKNN